MLENGETYSGKVVVGADGSYSRVSMRQRAPASLRQLYKAAMKQAIYCMGCR